MFFFKKKKKKKKDEEEDRPKLKSEAKRGILAIGFFTIATLSIMSFLGRAGEAGFMYFSLVKDFFGEGYWLIPILFFMLAVMIFRSLKKFNWGWFAFFGSTILTLSFLSVLDFILEGENGGGYFGKVLSLPLRRFFGFEASLVILLALIFISLLVILNTSPKTFWIFGKRKKAEVIDEEGEVEEEDEEQASLEDQEEAPEKKRGFSGLLSSILPKPKFKVKEVRDDSVEEDEGEQVQYEDSPVTPRASSGKVKAFEAPPLDLLEKESSKPVIGDINANTNIIKRTFENFGIEVEMADVNVGPTVTQFTLKPATGVKLSKIIALQDDLSLALAAHPIRIEAPIPGKSLVGIEVPNKKVATVRLREFLASDDFRKKSASLPVSIGRDVSGNPIFSDIAKMPHVLIAGSTGSGKSVYLHSLILSLLYKNSPETLKLIMIDPKRVELTFYNDIPYLMTPVIVEASKAINTLKWAVNEMEARYKMLEEDSVKDISSYNKLKNRETMPYIVIVIDELADLMTAYGKDLEAAIVRIAQMARAVGIHLVVATQRPSVEVITGLIKANITTRIAFQVASQIDSRTILDMAGAEKLLGSGDMLYLSADAAKPRRLQGVFVSEKEVKKVADFLRDGMEDDVDYDEGILGAQGKKPGSAGDSDMEDDLYEEAEQMVIEVGKASASYLQRRLRVGYARAARLIDMLEDRGVVGPAEGARPREVLVDNGSGLSEDDA